MFGKKKKTEEFVSASEDLKEYYIEKKSHVFLGLFPNGIAINLGKKITPLINFFKGINPNLEDNLKALSYSLKPEEYISIGFFSYTFFGTLIGILIWALAMKEGRPENIAILSGLGVWFVMTFFFTYLLVKLPASELKQKSIELDRYLIYGLKEMVIHANSGASFYEALVSVSNAKYGELTKQFDWIVRQVNMGIPMMDVLDETITRTTSDYYKKVIWQLINTLKTGSDLSAMLEPIIDELDYYQKSQIQNYARELNLWSLVYMIFSAAIPTIGSTMLIILSVFANFGIGEGFFIMFAVASLVIQMILIFVVNKRRPNVVF